MPAVRSAAILAGVGGLLSAVGFVYASLQWTSAAYCQNPATAASCSQGAAWDSVFLAYASTALAIVGLGLAVAGVLAIVWIVTDPRNAKGIPPASVVRATVGGSPGFCFVCGQRLGWVGPSGRWYCYRCAAYR